MYRSSRAGDQPANNQVRDLLVTIGNHGETFARDDLKLAMTDRSGRYGVVKQSNYLDQFIDQAAAAGYQRVLVVGHLGKLVKLGCAGLIASQSRIEALAACASEAGADILLLRQLLGCVSTDAATAALFEANRLAGTMQVLERRIQATFDANTPPDLQLEWICFSRLAEAFTLVAQSTTAFGLIREWHHL